MTESQVQDIRKTAGEILKALRQSQKLAVEDIATQMRLEVKIIEALEENHLDILPSPTYIRGYLRSYSKLLATNGDKIIALYNEQAPEPPEIIPDVRHSTQISSSDKPVKAFTYLVSFVFVLLLLAWLQSRYIVEKETGEAQATVTFVQENPQPVEVIPPELGPYVIDTLAPDKGDIETIVEPVKEAIAVTTASLATTPDRDPPVVEAETPVVDAPVDDDEMTGPDSINLKMTADSWIEIYDVYNEKVYMDLARSGDEINLRGTAPFRVKLGFSQGVILTFNGEPYDFSSYSIAGVARFSLGQ